MKDLKNEIKNKAFSSCYLFYGEEDFLKQYYSRAICDAVLSPDEGLMNLDTFEGKASAREIVLAAQTLPFMAEKRIVRVFDSKLFRPGRKDDSEMMATYFKEANPETILIFVEDDVDKRSHAFKEMSKVGRVISFSVLTDAELVRWVQRRCKEASLAMDAETALFMVEHVGRLLSHLSREVDKLIDYKSGAETVTVGDVEAVCTMSLEAKVFALMDLICARQTERAVALYENLMFMKESPLLILSVMSGQFKRLLQCHVLLRGRASETEIGGKLGLRGMALTSAVRQCRSFSGVMLKDAIVDCMETDVAMKTGRMDAEKGVLLLVVKYAKR